MTGFNLKSKRRAAVLMLIIVLVMSLFAGCGGDKNQPQEQSETAGTDESAVLDISDESIALSSAPPALTDTMLKAEASGTAVKKTSSAWIDYSNIADGYVMVKYLNAADKKIKAQVKGPADTYTYNLTGGEWETFPLSSGNGGYTVTVLENVEGTKYAVKASVTFNVQLKDEFAPFIRPNQYVDYENAPATIAKAEELCMNTESQLEKVSKVYEYVVTGFTYDTVKARTVQSGYLPVLDTVLQEKKGICFDYAAVMTGMLRSQGVPCKLVVGYAGTVYHAWISVYVEGQGWIEGVVYFDGTSWNRMDPTFASSGNQSEEIMKYIGNDNNYSAKYFY